MSNEEKLEAFRNFDFDGNEQWREHILKFDISGPNYSEKLGKLRAKWYRGNIDQDFDVSLAAGAKATKSEPPPTAESTKTESVGETNPGSSNNERPSATEQSSSTQSSSSPKTPHPTSAFTDLFLHVLLVLLGAWCILPFSTRTTQQIFLQFAMISHGVKIYRQFGGPTFRPFSALKAWAARALPSSDFQYASMSLIFLPRIPTRIVFVPSSCLAAYHAASYMSRHYKHTMLWKKYGSRVFLIMVLKQRLALKMNAAAEIAVGLFMLVQLLTPARNILTCFLFWQWLRTRYSTPDAAQYHRQIWSLLGERLEPFLFRVPFLRAPLGYVQRWFTTPTGRSG